MEITYNNTFLLKNLQSNCSLCGCSAIRCLSKAIEKSFRSKFSFRKTGKREINLLNWKTKGPYVPGERFILTSRLTLQGLFALVMGVTVCFRAMLKKIQIFFPEFWFGKRYMPFSDFTWYYMHLFVRFSQFQNCHTNMKRLDITLTKFIKLHDCIPVNIMFGLRFILRTFWV